MYSSIHGMHDNNSLSSMRELLIDQLRLVTELRLIEEINRIRGNGAVSIDEYLAVTEPYRRLLIEIKYQF